MAKAILFIFLLGLSGCGFVFQDLGQGQDQGLKYGMSQEEVVSKIGQPQKMSKMSIEKKEYDVWEYAQDKPKPEKMNALGVDYSKVFFLDGKLVQYAKDKVYGQPAYEYLESVEKDAEVTQNKIIESKDNLQ